MMKMMNGCLKVRKSLYMFSGEFYHLHFIFYLLQRKTSKKNNKYESTKHTTSTEISMKNISKKQMKTISTEISPTNITKVQLETTISAKNITKKQTEEVTSENSTINLTKPQLEINKEAEIPKDNDRGNVECRKCGKVFDNITLWQDHTCDHRLENEARLKQKEFKKRKNKQKCFECEYCHKGIKLSGYNSNKINIFC